MTDAVIEAHAIITSLYRDDVNPIVRHATNINSRKL